MSVDNINNDALQGKWEKLKKAREAYKAARFYMWVGLIAGFALLGARRLLDYLSVLIPGWAGAEHQSIAQGFIWSARGLAFIFEHLGIGLIVSAIAIFFYEWGAQLKETIELTGRLTGAVEHTKRMMEAIRMNQRLEELNNSRAELRLAFSLDTLIGGATKAGVVHPEYLRRLILNCKNLVLAVASLHERNDWASEQYLTFISDHIKKVVGHNAEAFSKLYEKKGEQHFIVPPTAAQMADEILAAQMQSLNEGGRYDVISDLPSWQEPQLALLHSATRDAIKENNVQVRRVFNLIRGIPLGTRQTLLKHLEHSDKWKGQTEQATYEVKILGVTAYKNLRSKGYSLQRIEEAHFGVFINGPEKVRFKVTERDLSDMALSKDTDLIDPSLSMFEAVWRYATDFPQGEKTGATARERIDQLLGEVEEWNRDKSEH